VHPAASSPEDRGQRTEDRRQRRPPRSVLSRSSCAPRRRESAPGEAPARRPFPTPPSLSVRQWFWTGLVQDRPTVIAWLSGLVLLGLSALAAGLCFLAETV
jgi:hypothetical protein